ncbi:Vitamin B12 import ATP-binding protein BtuD [Paenochrobactrum sp. BZR 201-1]
MDYPAKSYCNITVKNSSLQRYKTVLSDFTTKNDGSLMLYDPTAQEKIAVSVNGLSLAYGKTTILNNISLMLPKGQTLALLGPSGCGKTTLLRLLAGLLTPTKGDISINGTMVADAKSGLFLPPEKRHLGMVFQDYALWPHMSVEGNISFPLEMRGINRSDREKRVKVALERVGLGGFENRSISDMSGGQQQRVAIARAIVAEPKIVLFDEPLSNLDRELRENMVSELKQLVTNLGLTAVYVTHDQSEAFALADQVAIMRAGIIEQLADPQSLVAHPASTQVADFLRLGCVMPVEYCTQNYKIRGTNYYLQAPHYHQDHSHVLIPTRAISATSSQDDSVTAIVLRSQFRGDGHLTTVRIGDDTNVHEVTYLDQLPRPQGSQTALAIDHSQLRWFSN